MLTIVRVMAKPNSGLEIRDRIWLKITIPNAFIGKPVFAHLLNCINVLLIFPSDYQHWKPEKPQNIRKLIVIRKICRGSGNSECIKHFPSSRSSWLEKVTELTQAIKYFGWLNESNECQSPLEKIRKFHMKYEIKSGKSKLKFWKTPCLYITNYMSVIFFFLGNIIDLWFLFYF